MRGTELAIKHRISSNSLNKNRDKIEWTEINKLLRRKSTEIVQYQHNNKKYTEKIKD